MVNRYNYIIVGLGLAGSLLAYFLIKAGKRVLVVDSFKPNSSSRVAAGLINPVTGRQMVKTWQADTLLPFTENTYLELKEYFKKTFFFKQNITRLFASAEQKNVWELKTRSAEYENYWSSDPMLPAPYFAANFTNNLLHGTPLIPETDISRFSIGKK